MNKEENFKVIKHGSFDIEHLSEEEQKTFYMTLFARILELYKKRKEEN